MKLPLVLALIAGLVLAVALVLVNGVAEISRAILGVGWGILAIIGFHLVQLVFAAAAWRSLLGRVRGGGVSFLGLRWIREAVGALLPVAQIGAEFVGARLLALSGVAVSLAGASVIVDLTMELISQIAFTLVGFLLWLDRAQGGASAHGLAIATALGLAALIASGFILAQRRGLFQWIESALLRLARRTGWTSLQAIAGLHDAIIALHRDRRRLWLSSGSHLVSWMLGGLEVVLILHFVGIEIGWREGLIIESLGQAIRVAGFAVPGQIGIQEGAYVLVCGLVGIPAQGAIELSLLKRIRELAFGVPGLIAWQFIEGRRLARRPVPASGRLS